MDRKSTIGLIIIGVILTVWVILSNYKSPEQKAAIKKHNDSVMAANDKKVKADSIANLALKAKNDSVAKLTAPKDTTPAAIAVSDSMKQAIALKSWRDFAPATKGEDKCVTLENEKIKVSICTKGGRIGSVILKEYKRSNGTGKELVELFEKEQSKQDIVLNAYNDRTIHTDSLYFTTTSESVSVSGDQSKSVILKMPLAANGSYIEYIYSLKGNDYMVDFKMNFVKMESILSEQAPVIFEWNMKYPSQEMHISKERATSGIFFMNSKEDVDNLSMTSKEENKVITDAEIKWVAMKQQFFTAAVLNKGTFATGTNLSVTNYGVEDKPQPLYDQKYVKNVNAKLFLQDLTGKKSFDLSFYFGPNHYKTLKGYDQNLEKMIPMGWWLFSYINKGIVVPIFALFKDSGLSFGWVILILTLIIKGLLFPIGYMTYKSSAKMKALKPETDALAEKFGKDGDQMKKQQETMALYRKAGVSPFSGCLPLVFQMFVLIALFNFFPAAIDLRQQSFWWSDDLSTYDSVWNFGFRVPGYGDHMSMFALMMFVSTLGFTWYQQKMFPNQQTGMPGMKFMMYLMPVIFLSFMNDYSAGLSWYYFVANVINIVQNLVLRKFIDDKKLRTQIEAHMKKPTAKKSGFAARLEEAAKQRQRQIKK